MNKTRLIMRRAAIALIGITILAVGASAVTAASTTSTNQTSPTPVGEPTGGGSPPPNPCSLVTLSNAQGIANVISGLTEAPLGPTCLYKRSDRKASITLTVGPMNYAKVTHGLTNTVPVTIGKYSGVCGTLGPQVLYLSLGANRVLNIVAPCSIAKAFATVAASNL